MNADGEMIDATSQQYIWMAPFLNGMATNNPIMKDYADGVPVDLTVPITPFLWEFMGGHFGQFLMVLAGAISSFHCR